MALAQHDVQGEAVRVVDHDVHPGVEKDMGNGDAWPALREKVLAADILLVATPTWMGQASNVCMRVLERLDAELSETDDQGRPSMYGKVPVVAVVAMVAVVGNEDGAHHVSSQLYQRWLMSASRSRHRASRTGTARRCRAPITRTWTRRLRPRQRLPGPLRPTPPTWHACCGRPTTPAARKRQTRTVPVEDGHSTTTDWAELLCEKAKLEGRWRLFMSPGEQVATG